MLSIEEAWNLPISAEMSSRQQQSSNQTSRNGTSQSFPKTPQGPPPPYPSPGTNKPFKTEEKTLPTQQSYSLTQQQLQLLQCFQQNINNLTPPQQTLMQHLQHQYRIMQQQIRQNQKPPVPTPLTYGHNFESPLTTAKSFSASTEKLVQPTPLVGPRDFLSPAHHSTDIDEHLEEDLKDLLSQKDLAATLAENLLKHFGSDGTDIKEEPTGFNTEGK